MRHRGERGRDMNHKERRFGIVIAVGVGVLVLLVGLFLIIALT